jgi:MFS family permease
LKVRLGFKLVLRLSGILIFLGLLFSVIWPSFYASIAGFFFVGMGVSAVVPLCFSEAGKSIKMSASAAIASVSTLGFLGFLLGPPVIGWVAGASSLRVSFFIISLLGLSISFLASRAPET